MIDLTVQDVSAIEITASIECDYYVPLRYETSSRPIGGTFLAFGNGSTKLAEFLIDNARAVRGFTLTCFDGLTPFPPFEVEESRRGLPVLRHVERRHAPSAMLDFGVSLDARTLLISWGSVARCVAFAAGPARFLASEGRLVGVLFPDLSEEDVSCLRDYEQRHR